MNATDRARPRGAQSSASDEVQAVREFHAAVAQPEMALVVFFCSSQYRLDTLAAEMARLFAGVPLIGCTTAGEIGPIGCCDHSLSGASFPATDFSAAVGHIDRLQEFDGTRGQALAQELLRELERRAPQADASNTVALLLIDGLSVCEELVTRTVQNALGAVPLVGGSAGDGLAFGQTHVYFDGRFHADGAVLAALSSAQPFRVFKTQHFVATPQRLVVTAADPARRLVSEIDGRPAAEAFAQLVGVRVDDLDPLRFAASPMVVVIDGSNYVRSIQRADADGSLRFFCAIEEGLVLRLARGVDMVENLEEAFAAIVGAIGEPQLVLAFNCILRKLEASQREVAERVEIVLRAHSTVGFNGYGEQYRGVHVNQTLTGIAFGGNHVRAGRD